MESGTQDLRANRTVRYELDSADRVIAVDDAWRAFAHANGGADLDGVMLLGQEIWRYIGDSATQVIYRLLFDAVRTRLRPITVFLRCDGPRERRLLALTCAPAPRLGLHLTSRSVRTEARAYVSLLDSSVARSGERIVICAWCKKIRADDGDWREIESATDSFDSHHPPQLDHQICPECQIETLKGIRHSVLTLDDEADRGRAEALRMPAAGGDS